MRSAQGYFGLFEMFLFFHAYLLVSVHRVLTMVSVEKKPPQLEQVKWAGATAGIQFITGDV